MTAILASDVFPGLDTTNPLDSNEVDAIPPRFGSSWYEYDRDEKKEEESKERGHVFGEVKNPIVEVNEDDELGQGLFDKDDEQIEYLDSHIDQ